MLKRIRDYIPEFKNNYYVNEFGEYYREVKLKKSSNGSYDCRVEFGKRCYRLGKDLQEFLRDAFDIHLCVKYGNPRVPQYYFNGTYWVIKSKLDVLYIDGRFFVERPVDKQSDGYKYIHSGRRHYTMHSVVYRCFVGEIYDGNVLHHRDRDRANNWYRNLVQLTRAQHMEEHRYELK